MRIESNDELSPNAVAAMRTLYAAPDAVSYWTALQARILDGIRTTGDSADREIPLWSVLSQWATPGLAAAALLLAMAGALWARLDQSELRATYDGFTQPMIADAIPGAAQLLNLPRDGRSQREATLNYVLSH